MEVDLTSLLFNKQNCDSVVRAFVIPFGNVFITDFIAQKEITDFLKEHEIGIEDLKDETLGFSVMEVAANDKWNCLTKQRAWCDMDDNVCQIVNVSLQLQQGDVVFLAQGLRNSAAYVLGQLRLLFADVAERNNYPLERNHCYNFMWVTDFPLFIESEGGYDCHHHPFTAPLPQHIDMVYSDPLKAHGQHFDLVLNGVEIGGGSMRVHDSSLQEYILHKVLKVDIHPFDHLLRALHCGCPPHGGIALGLDRLIALMTKASSIRDVIAFPKVSLGRDLLTRAPSEL
ncbi:aspartate--tRNA ligase, mitochondrial-like isoform X2 [Corticium candelabrum]|uniref:aspartate--tRNA ligase, mitochondrial-like isoform X2 n=1 Tax=Corticium candelabrum TaxID=121492 RepID=UPI002E2681A3|nr:aspartate--tRNA ligase, mitochondrial-like isoform X2 [Corticium candelabrum]